MDLSSEEQFKERLSFAISKNGGPKGVAQKTGISVSTINKYIAKSSTPSFSTATKIAGALGIDLEWLAFGQSSNPVNSSGIKTDPINENVMERLAVIVTSAYRDAGHHIPKEKVTTEATRLYNALILRVPDLSDEEMISVELVPLITRLERRLKEASENPGTGKRSAS